MHDELSALSLALRRPMARWWLRTGLPLLVVAVLLQLLPLWLDGLDYAQQFNYGIVYSLLHALFFFTPALAALCWLLAAMRVIELCRRLIRSDPQLELGRLDISIFLIALRQGLWPLLTLLLFSLSYHGLVEGRLLSAADHLSPDVMLWWGGVSFFQSVALIMLFIIALASLRGVPAWRPWLWYMGLVGYDSLESYLSFGPGWDLREILPHAEYSGVGLPLLQLYYLCGYLALYAVLYYGARERASRPLLPATVLGVFFLLGAVDLGSGDYFLDEQLGWLYSARLSAGLLPAGYNFEYFDLFLLFSPGKEPIREFITFAPLGVFISLLLGSCWLALHYSLLRRLVTRQPLIWRSAREEEVREDSVDIIS